MSSSSSSKTVLLVAVLAFVFRGSIITAAAAHDDQETTFLWESLVNMPSKSLLVAFLPKYIDLSHVLTSNRNLTTECVRDLKFALDSVQQRQTWALKMFDSWAKFPPNGALSGTLTDFGDYDQCLSIKDLSPQYCLMDIEVPMPRPMPKNHNYFHRSSGLLPRHQHNHTTLQNNGTVYHYLADVSSVFYYLYVQIGICIPKSCTEEDIHSVAVKETKKAGLVLNKFFCDSKSDSSWEPNFFQVCAIVTLISTIALVMLAALYDRFVGKKSGTLQERVLLWFSPFRNIRKLICTKSHDDLTCIHGIRFLTIIWIIICHTLEWNNLNMFRDAFQIKDKLSSIEKQPLLNGHYSVETFFYISGLLTSYVVIKYTYGEYKNFGYISFFVLRYLRLTPQLGIFLLFSSMVPPLFDGPIWNSYISKMSEKCYVSWWRNLIYVHNLFDLENICAIHTWYLAADMQLHWMSLIPVILLLKNRRNAVLYTKLFILVCIFISGITIFFQQLPPGSVLTSKNDFLDENGVPSQFVSFLYKPWNHAYVFFTGFIFGSYLQNMQSITLKKSTKYLLWLVAFFGYLCCIYATLPWLHGRPYDPFWSAIMFPMSRLVWALVLTLTIWLCVTKNGTIVGRILSWSGFRPLSRLTYSVYLTHAWVVWVGLGTRRQLIDLRTHSVVLLTLSLIVLSFVVAFVFTILFETPLVHLIEYIKSECLPRNKTSEAANGNNNKCEKEIKLLQVQSSSI